MVVAGVVISLLLANGVEPLAVELGAVMKFRCGPSSAVGHVEVPMAGVLHVWARSDGEQPTIRIEGPGDTAIAEAEPVRGGGATYLEITCADGGRYSVRLTTPVDCELTMKASFSRETESSLALVRDLQSLRTQLADALELHDMEGVRAAVFAIRNRVTTDLARTSSHAARVALDELLDSDEMRRAEDMDSLRGEIRRAQADVADVQLRLVERVYPREHERTRRAIHHVVFESNQDPTRMGKLAELIPRIVGDLEESRVTDPGRLALAFHVRSVARSSLGDWSGAEADGVRALEQVEKDPERAPLRRAVLALLGSTRFIAGDAFGARAALTQAVVDYERAQVSRSARDRFDTELQLAVVHFSCGEIERAHQSISELDALIGTHPELPAGLVWKLRLWQARIDSVLEPSQTALDRFDRANPDPELVVLDPLLGLMRISILCETGRVDEAIRSFDTFAGHWSKQQDPTGGMAALLALHAMNIADAAGDRARLFAASTRFLQAFQRAKFGYTWGARMRAVALIAAAALDRCAADAPMDRVSADLIRDIRLGYVTFALCATSAELDASVATSFASLSYALAASSDRTLDADSLETNSAIVDAVDVALGLPAVSAAALRSTSQLPSASRIDAMRQAWSFTLSMLNSTMQGNAPAGAAALASEVEYLERSVRSEIRRTPELSSLLERVTSEAVGSVLAPGEVALSYLVLPRISPCEIGTRSTSEQFDTHILCIVRVAGQRPSIVELGALDVVLQELSRLGPAATPARGRAVETNGGGAVAKDAALSRLRRVLLEPVLVGIDEPIRLIVVPTDELHGVPWEALCLVDARTARWPLQLRSSLSECWVDELRGPSAESTSFVLVGDLDFDSVADGELELTAPLQRVHAPADLVELGVRLAPLPGTRRELDAVEREIVACGVEPTAVVRLTGPSCSKSRWHDVAKHARVIHIASHGLVRTDPVPSAAAMRSTKRWLGFETTGSATVSRYLECGLAISGANLPRDPSGQYPGVLSGAEIAVSDLSHCELVVLAACATNTGFVSAGRGVASLQESFRLAGAHAVMSTLWPVKDDVASEFMAEFHRRLWSAKTSPRVALRETKIALRGAKLPDGKLRYDVSDWAAFVLYGGD